MQAAPPPEATILAITGLGGPADLAAVQAALLRCDPAARIWTDGPRGLVAVLSAAPATALCAAVQGAGYGVLVRGGPARRGGIGRALGFAVLFGVVGALGGSVLGVLLGLGNSMFNPACVGSGNCAIGVGVFGVLGALVGGPVGVVAGLIAGFARRG